MLSREEKKEMLEDARSEIRRNNFREARENATEDMSLDEYLSFLDSVQKIFKPFTISRRTTPTEFNKL